MEVAEARTWPIWETKNLMNSNPHIFLSPNCVSRHVVAPSTRLIDTVLTQLGVSMKNAAATTGKTSTCDGVQKHAERMGFEPMVQV